MMDNDISLLKDLKIVQSEEIYKQLIRSHRALAELKVKCDIIPNENILLNTLILQEAKGSSEIENIITSHDELFRSQLFDIDYSDPQTKEVNLYSKAIKQTYKEIKELGIISNRHIQNIQEILEDNSAGYRKVPGTKLINNITNEIVYVPPQDHQTIVRLMDDLINYINVNNEADEIDKLVKLAVIHHRFETIHPFFDGNGRTGRIINVLYLVKEGYLNLPVLYLSRYILETKSKYYELLQKVRITNEWEEWILYILKAIEITSTETNQLIEKISILLSDYKHRIRNEMPEIYSHDLINNLFKHPYTKIEYLANDIGKNRKTAASYLNKLVSNGYLQKVKYGNSNYYINYPLFLLFANEKTAQDMQHEIIKTLSIE